LNYILLKKNKQRRTKNKKLKVGLGEDQKRFDPMRLTALFPGGGGGGWGRNVRKPGGKTCKKTLPYFGRAKKGKCETTQRKT